MNSINLKRNNFASLKIISKNKTINIIPFFPEISFYLAKMFFRLNFRNALSLQPPYN